MTGFCGQMADNNHTKSIIFPFFLLGSKTSHWETSQKQPVKLIKLTGLFLYMVPLIIEESKKTTFFYYPFKLKLMPSVSNSHNELHTEILLHFTNKIFLNDY